MGFSYMSQTLLRKITRISPEEPSEPTTHCNILLVYNDNNNNNNNNKFKITRGQGGPSVQLYSEEYPTKCWRRQTQ